MLTDPSSKVPLNAILGLREFGYRDSAANLIALATAQSPQLRHVAVQALGEIAIDHLAPQYQDRILQALIAALDDSVFQSIRTKAIRALAQTDDRRAVAPLERLQHNGTLEKTNGKPDGLWNAS
jgi:HEAT repeat protein